MLLSLFVLLYVSLVEIQHEGVLLQSFPNSMFGGHTGRKAAIVGVLTPWKLSNATN